MDGVMLGFVARELDAKLKDGRVDRVIQPERDEIHLLIRAQGANHRLVLSASANAARIHLSEHAKTGPMEPPMFCMLLRKYLGSGRVQSVRRIGGDRILEIEIQGALKIKEKFPDTVLMFITAPSAEVLKERLVGRGTETQEVVDARMSRAYEESLGVESYDYLVINDDLDACVELVHDIIQKERTEETEVHAENRVSANIEFINNMRRELLSFSKGV
jgi:hypothetical protein